MSDVNDKRLRFCGLTYLGTPAAHDIPSIKHNPANLAEFVNGNKHKTETGADKLELPVTLWLVCGEAGFVVKITTGPTPLVVAVDSTVLALHCVCAGSGCLQQAGKMPDEPVSTNDGLWELGEGNDPFGLLAVWKFSYLVPAI
ncbi:MAG: hypothetical protein CMJ81_16120 [Planctomycetaceae bacterium]|nr:hypothetical protein [Planctomycetaceae bacterium]